MTVERFPPLAALLPHEGRALLLERIVEVSSLGVVCAARLGEDCGYARHGRIPAFVAMELIAQAGAALAALEASACGSSAPVGYLVAVPRMSFFVSDFPVDAELAIHAERQGSTKRARSLRGSVRLGDEVIAEGTLTLVVHGS